MAVQFKEEYENEIVDTESKEAALNLDPLFYPKNIAVVGASPKSSGFMWGGNTFIEGALNQGFKGKIFPIHPKAETIMGMKVYKKITDIPDEIDLAIFSVPHAVVLDVMRDCVTKGVKFVHLFTAGFSETGKAENAQLEKDLLAIAHEGGVRLVGPNCMGIFNPEGGMAWTSEFPRFQGEVGFVSQSGQLAGQFTGSAQGQGMGFSKVVSFGNGSDLQAHDFLNYLAEDDKTKIIGSYIEGLKNGRAFFETAKKVTAKKPLVVWKSGLTEGGSRATRSHTAAIAGSPKIWKAVCRQTGIIPVDSMEELTATMAGIYKMPKLPEGTRAGILGGAGGGSVTMTDAAERHGVTVPHLADRTIAELEKIVPLQGNSVKNPLDMMGSLFVKDNFIKLMELLRDDPNIDVLIYTQMMRPRGGVDFVDMFVNMTLEGIKVIEKPVYVVLEQGGPLETEISRQQALKKYNYKGIPTFSSFNLAASVLYNMDQYRQFKESHK